MCEIRSNFGKIVGKVWPNFRKILTKIEKELPVKFLRILGVTVGELLRNYRELRESMEEFGKILH